MSTVPGAAENRFNPLNDFAFHRAIAQLLGEEPEHIVLDRTHFPGRRPLQMNFLVRLPSGVETTIFAERCTENLLAYRESVMTSLRKSRRGQRPGLTGQAILADERTGFVLRRRGLDERLPGLRMLYDQAFARDILRRLLSRDPGPVTVRLVAHRLGKRAVLRVDAGDQTIYARLRATKSTNGAERYARHRLLWATCAGCTHLRVPEPLGALPELGLSLVSELPGEAPNFGKAHSSAIAQALSELRQLDLPDLPVHSGLDEARLLRDWLMRCRQYLPEFASRLEAGIKDVTTGLAQSEPALRTCHRDIHEKQILMADGVAGLLDFDTLSLADPALDAGNLLAHLYLAEEDENPLRNAIDIPGLSLWRRAALCRLSMIYAFSSTSDDTLKRLVQEAERDAGH